VHHAGEGWSALAIYERHKEELTTISYRQFLRYVAAWRPPSLVPRDASKTSRAAPSPATRTHTPTNPVRQQPLDAEDGDDADDLAPDFSGSLKG
jgi:hypothetical protein